MTRIVDRRSAAGGGVEYRLREGLRNPLEENPDTDTWKPASECDPATVAEAETWLGSPQAPFKRSVPVEVHDEGRRKRRPENKSVVDELDLPSVPEYNPTAEQFKDPLAYIQTIYDQAALYGVCIINPPKESWKVSVGPTDWESACKTAGRLSAFDVKKQRLLNAQRKTGDPGFEYYNKQLNLAQYEKETKRFQEQVRKSLPRPVDIDDEIDVETAFFDTMAREAGNQTVIYGNDVEGTLLENDDAVKDNPWAPMRISLHGRPPNLHDADPADSPIRALGDDCPGITRPYMYFGMFFTFFCWHTEDNDLYSINYMIGGKPKTWYAVPDHAAEGFEKVLKDTYPDFHERMPDLQYRKCLMLPPHKLLAAKVPVYRAVQRENQIVITFPRGYHGGFSHGFNYAESSNFALPTWLEYGSRSAELYRKASVDVKAKRKQSEGRNTVIGIDMLLWNICVDQAKSKDRLGTTTYSESVTAVARQQLARRLRRELRDRQTMREHHEPAVVIEDNSPDTAAGGGADAMDVSDEQDTSTSGEDDGEEAEYVVEAIEGTRVAKGGKGREYFVKWKGYDRSDNTWEPEANLEGNEMLASFKAATGKGKARAEVAQGPEKMDQKKRKEPEPAGKLALQTSAVGAEAAEAPAPMQAMKVTQLEQGGIDWDLREEPCHHCRHPCFFTLIRSDHPDAVVPSGNINDEDGENYVVQMKGGGASAAEADPAAAPIPLVSCLSPCCISKLPGTLEQLEIVQFYDDATLARVLAECEEKGCGQGRAENPLPSFRPNGLDEVLQKNPVKKKFFPRHEETIKKDDECKAKLAKWWAAHMKGKQPGDVSGTLVDENEKLRLAEEVGLTKKKIDYWLWAERKKEKKKAGATGKENTTGEGASKKKAKVR